MTQPRQLPTNVIPLNGSQPEPMFPLAPEKPGDQADVTLKRRTLRLIQTDNRALRAALADSARKLEAMTSTAESFAIRAQNAENRLLIATSDRARLLTYNRALMDQVERLMRLDAATRVVIPTGSNHRALLCGPDDSNLWERCCDWLCRKLRKASAIPAPINLTTTFLP